MEISQLPHLLSGSKVALVAPAGRVKREEIETCLQKLKEWKFEPVFGEHLFDDFFFGYHYAGMPENRLKDLQWALSSPEIDAIWCARGGYGCAHLLKELSPNGFLEKPKWLVGYSDITAIHQWLQKNGIPSIHGVTAKLLNTDYSSETFSSIQEVFCGPISDYTFESETANCSGKATGRLIGGNLSILYSLVGTSYSATQAGDILFIEDWNENWYALDRMLTSLIQSNYFDGINGIIIGNFTRMDVKEDHLDFHSSFDSTSYQIIKKILSPLDIPLAFGFPAGHTGDNRAIVLGLDVTLEVGSNSASLKFL